MTTRIKETVMRRVRAAYYLRPFASTGALSAVLVLVSIYAVSREVWVAMIVENMPSLSDLGAVGLFFASAFMNTSFLVQAFSVLAFGSALMLAREGVKLLVEATRSEASPVSA